MGLFNDRFKELKDEKSIMLKDLASDLGITNSKLSYYLNGSSEPSYELLIEIAKYFNVTTDYLTGMSNFKRIEDSLLVSSFENKSLANSFSDKQKEAIDNYCVKLYDLTVRLALTEDKEDLEQIWGMISIWLSGLDRLISFIEGYHKNEIKLQTGRKAMDDFSYSRALAGSKISSYLSDILDNHSIDESIKNLIGKRTSYSIKKQKNEDDELDNLEQN